MRESRRQHLVAVELPMRIIGREQQHLVAAELVDHAFELRRVRGLKSQAVRELLPRASEEAVHRDYFVLA